jgi:Rieske Fe-S protein
LQPGAGQNGNDILIVGGEDHRTGQADDADERYDRLEAWTRERFPVAQTVQFHWSGQVMESIDGLAYIGLDLTDGPNVYIATGDSGMGMTHGTIAAMLLTDLILKRRNPWAALYDPARFPLRAVSDFAQEGLKTFSQYSEWLNEGMVEKLRQIAPGTGAIIRRGLKKLAVYRDEQGNLHQCLAVCPHLGCVVAWNSKEHTWDCPCHGSQFDPYGRVINGPARDDLASHNG